MRPVLAEYDTLDPSAFGGSVPSVVAQSVAAIALVLLGLGGVAKVVDPDPTSGALKAARLPHRRFVVRGLGLAEIASAAVALAIGGVAAAPGALLYTGFVVFTLAAVLRRIPVQSCGCFGRDDTPPSWLHVAYNLVAAAAITWVAVAGSAPIPWQEPVLVVLGYLFFALVGAGASYLILDALPRALKPPIAA